LRKKKFSDVTVDQQNVKKVAAAGRMACNGVYGRDEAAAKAYTSSGRKANQIGENRW
jgi:hypothetical protein